MDTKEVLARFEAERQALAMMDHPNIATVYEAGATDEGRPYFVMELVRGEQITHYCDKNNLSVRQRLELYAQVCDAIQHAHTKGIIHRDIKPSNVMVTVLEGKPLVKVIDFGVAKATNQRLTEKTLFTEQGQIIGTPEYMSPEQAEMSGMDVDTRTDIYSLGVLLYELLTGSLPFDPKTLRTAAYVEMQRMIREVDPPKPSTRLTNLSQEQATKVAQKRKTALATLAQELRQELEWIPLKAMRKDRTERYRTAAELGDDIRNYLGGKPLIAGPESAAYRIRKFVRRNRKQVVVTSAVAALLLTMAIAASVLIRRAHDRQLRAEERQRVEQAAAAQNFTLATGAVHDVFTTLRQDTLLGRPEMLGLQKRMLQYAVDYSKKLAALKANDPARREDLAQAYNQLGAVYTGLGDFAAARMALDESLRIRRELLTEDPQDTQRQYNVAAVLNNVGDAYRGERNFTAAEDSIQQAIAILNQITSTGSNTAALIDLAATYRNLGSVLGDQDKLNLAPQWYSKAIAIQEKLAAAQPLEERYQIDLAEGLFNLAIVQHQLNKPQDALTTMKRAADIERAVSDRNPRNGEVLELLARMYGLLCDWNTDAGDKAAADESLAKSQKIWQQLSAGYATNPRLAKALGTLAWLQIRSHDYKGAIDSATRALQADDSMLWIRGNLAHALLFDGQTDAAKRIYDRYKNERTNPNQTMREMVLSDFDTLSKAGQEPPHRQEIETLLRPAAR
jgi:serine/threonine protein kinase